MWIYLLSWVEWCPFSQDIHWNLWLWLYLEIMFFAERGQQRVRWLDSITDSMDMNLSKHQEMVKGREVWHAAVHGAAKSGTRQVDWSTTKDVIKLKMLRWNHPNLSEWAINPLLSLYQEGRGKWKRHRGEGWVRKRWRLERCNPEKLEEERKRLETEEGRGKTSPESLEGAQTRCHLDFGLWPPEQKIVVVCYGSPRKWTHMYTRGNWYKWIHS